MRWFRLQLPVLYLASLLLAGAVPCAGHATAHEAAAPAHQQHAEHAHHAAHEAPAQPCHAGQAICACKALADEMQTAVAKPRDEMPAPALAVTAEFAAAEGWSLQPPRQGSPPERQSHVTSSYDAIHGRSARLLI